MTIDTRTEAERRYDAQRDGSAYTKATCITCGDDGDCPDCGKPSTLLLAVAAYIDGPAQLQIERHATDEYGEPQEDPWTTYRLGAAELDLNDAGGGNLVIPGHCLDFQDHAPLHDLVQLLSNPTVQQALDHAGDDTYTPCSPAWEAVLDITAGPLASDEDEAEDEEEETYRPVPPVPAGYPLDKALIYKSYGEVFIAIDRRDGEMVICGKEDTQGTILSPAYAQALYRFLWQDDIRELMEYHRRACK